MHADTQGQSECVVGLAYLLAIRLMPRIRNWKQLKLYLPSPVFPVQPTADLFADTKEQRKIIRYTHLVANLVVFHNGVSMTRVLQELIDEGQPVTAEIIAHLAPYRTEHINRLGSYEIQLDQTPEPITGDLQW